MLLALFLLQLAAGMYLFLPLVGRRVAGTKFYRMMFVIIASLALSASLAHQLAGATDLAILDGVCAVFLGAGYFFLKWPKRLVFFTSVALAGSALTIALLWSSAASIAASGVWSWIGSLGGAALLGSVTLAMLLGHWYLVVRGMPIDPLSRLTTALLISAIIRVILVGIALIVLAQSGLERETPLWNLAIRDGIFFWMRIGWGLIAPLMLYPMIRGTVRLRSTMAATGILYVAVVAVFIGEVLATYLSASNRFPV